MTLELPQWLDKDKQVELFGDPRQKLVAPKVLWGCLLALSDGKMPTANLAEVHVYGGVTHWNLVWLTTHDFLYVDATKHREGWSAEDRDEDAGVIEKLDAWSRPVSAITAVELTTAHAMIDRRSGGEDWWAAITRIVFGRDAAILVPPFGTVEDKQHSQALTGFISALHRARAAHSF